jgi:hypothetical protein
MPTEVFLDTAYAIALSSPNDQFHTHAVALAEQLEATGTRLVTSGVRDVLPGMNAGASPYAVPSPIEGSGTA